METEAGGITRAALAEAMRLLQQMPRPRGIVSPAEIREANRRYRDHSIPEEQREHMKQQWGGYVR